MNYKESLKYLNSFINYEKTPPKSHAELNLERMRHGLALLGHPENSFFPILITGTVGKGSTGFFLEQILQNAKISAGFYHSPHVDDIRERIRVRGKMLAQKNWANELTFLRRSFQKKPFPKKLGNPTFFEILTLLAILIFSKEKLRIGIFEIGMGGRLDATNVLSAPLCLLTRIDFDHQAFLGNTLAKIAYEKAGIIKAAPRIVTAPQAPEAMKVIRSAIPSSSRLLVAKPVSFQPGLQGAFQKQNAGNAAVAAKELNRFFDFQISEKNIRQGLKVSDWPGRIETVSFKKRKIILDAAHNPAGCAQLFASLKKMKEKPDWIIFSALRDKDSKQMLRALSKFCVPIVVTKLQNPRAKTAEELVGEAKGFFDKIISSAGVKEALRVSLENTRPNSKIVVTGSFYLLGEMHQNLKAWK